MYSKITTITGAIVFVMLFGIACQNAPAPKKADSQTITYDSVEVTNDGYTEGNEYKRLKSE